MGGNKSKDSLQPQLEGATYLWQVEKYSNISPLEPELSSDFEVFEDSYRLELHKDSHLEIKLHQMKASKMLQKFRCVSSFLDPRGITYFSETKEIEIGKSTNDVVLLRVPETLLDEIPVCQTNEFYISIKICAVSDSSESTVEDMNKATGTLSSDLGKLYCNKTDADVEIRTNTDKRFKAHRLILSARSPVFAAMFRHGTTERLKGIVNITDVEVSTVADLLYYIYTGKVSGLDSNTATQLIVVADKYDLQELKGTCLAFLQSNLTMDNICDAVILTEMCETSSLKKEVQAFMSNNMAEVIQSDNWKTLQDQRPDIVNSTLATLLISEKDKVK